MTAVKPCPLPEDALLREAVRDGAYTDCFATDVGRVVTHAQFVEAFYTSRLFRVERFILACAMRRKFKDADAKRLADGDADTFAAWRVEARAANQLLLADIHGRTRSWLMTAALAQGAGTRLHFGSAVGPKRDGATGSRSMGFAFHALLGFHKAYSRALLRAAVARLR
ncbi:MAG: hypothetical protein U1F15_15350 [Burkholderiales bacterium]